MRTLRRRTTAAAIVSATLAALLVFAAPPAGARSSQQQRLEQTRRALRAARSRLASLRSTDAQLMSVISSVQGQLDGAKTLLSQAQSNLADLDAKINSYERQVAKLQADRIARAKAVNARVASLYMMGPAIDAGALMSSGDFETYADRSSTFDFVLRNDKLTMEDYGKLSSRSRKAQRLLQQAAEDAQVWRRHVSERVALVWDALSTHQQAEHALSQRIKDYQDEVRSLEAEQRAIENIINSRGSYSVGPVSLRGFQWPTGSHHINSPYGPRWGGFHTGIDIKCATGEADYAAKAGTVIAAQWGGGYGKMVIIDHGNGVSTLYAHHSAILVHEGQHVDRGQRIASCGSTGHSTGSHLHFEIRVNGHHINPRPYLP